VPPATDDALETLDRWLAAFDAEASLAVLHRELRALARRERRRHAAARRVLDRESSEVGAVETLRRQAESVLAHLDRIPAGTARVRLPDPYGGPDLDIELDPRRRPAAAAEALFQRARRLERRREHLDARRTELEATARRLEHLEGVLESSDATALEETARQLVAEGTLDARVLAGEPARPPAAAPRRPYRVIELGDGWEVWVGRSSADNDELTHRLAAPHDLWLHAFGAAGAHVILRRTDGGRAHPPRRLIERAAAIAAYHSNARHSGAVPVSVTERRYVRRPRNAPPGTAVTLRDETLMVEPWQPTTGR
jgi:predicted ribosome quality control (RQC) complex YloA/Tae2 family protein